jgi:hypothetical protein
LRLSSIPTTWTEKWGFVSASHGSLSCVISRNLRNMAPDPQGYASRGTAGSSGMRLLGHCSHGNLDFPFNTCPGLLPAGPSLHRPFPSPLHWFLR